MPAAVRKSYARVSHRRACCSLLITRVRGVSAEALSGDRPIVMRRLWPYR